jgi:alcohol dehydrogenase (cytochrome c)/quinohemoprotein ethanol dehydrogenase
MQSRFITLAVTLTLLAACSSKNNPDASSDAAVAKPTAMVDAARIAAADASSWLSYGRTYDEQRHSPLTKVDASNVKQLGLAWNFDLDTKRAQESTPLVIDGVMYVTSAWSKLFALDAKSGKLLWKYDPKVPGETGLNACCDVVNRGAAAWNGKIYFATLDGRLLAVDAASGQLAWEVKTTPAGSRYTITGAPRIVKGKVLIGNGGAEVGVRGYVTAYDAATGAQSWRFYTVPGDPKQPFESPQLEAAAKTWSGAWWKQGGGGTVWDSMVYDDKLDLVYIGSGNGSPWDRKLRSPKGGDNLYLSSIIALKPDTGEYVWHYQVTPGDSWDYTATQPLMLADLNINGAPRQIIMQAPKNGFFYVLDRKTGELLSAKAYATVNWAKGIDMKTGRPIEVKGVRFGETGVPFVSMPGPGGAHSWQPMAYNPTTGLVYIPVMDVGFPYIPEGKNFKHRDLAWNTGVNFDAGSLPQDPAVKKQIKASLKGYLVAWDPVAQKEAWRVTLASPWNGGALSTAGNLVFQGNARGEFVAYNAATGERLWSAETQAGVLAPPISYAIDGEQYVAIEVGWGGAFGLAAGELARDTHIASNIGRVLVYKLGGSAQLPPVPVVNASLNPPAETANAATVAQGKILFHTYCGVCHGDSAVSSGVLPDLRYSVYLNSAAAWSAPVLQGALQSNGMVNFSKEVSAEDAEKIRAYVVRRAHESQKE